MPVAKTSYRRIGALVAVAAFYLLTARAGLLLHAVGGFATFVWAPSGIAIAAALLLGTRVWPAIFVAAFVTNFIAGASVVTAVAIGTGNTLEALVAAVGLRRAGFDVSLERLRDAYIFMLAAALAPIVSATIGVVSLLVSGSLLRSQAAFAWQAWWLGDFIGALVVAPLILSWRALGTRGLTLRDAAELGAILAALAVVSGFVFFAPLPESVPFLEAYLVFPVLLWASVRFEQRGATAGVLLTAIVAIAGTARHSGPFARPDLSVSLFELQTFMGIAAATILVLSTALAERTRVQADVESANRAKSEFLATMSHELRTPLNAIGGYAELLELGVHGALTPAQLEPVERIKRSERRLRSLIDDVLNFARIEAGRVELALGAVKLNDAIRECETLLTPQLQARQMKFSFKACEPALVAWADAEKVQQILLNLLANAVKFTPEHGSIAISCAAIGDRVEIRVRDSGVGIPQDKREVIFDPFVQLGRSLTSPQEGSGLGLAISRDLARAMNGDLVVRSDPGQGSVFTLSLPATS